jgi:hypothetical protein
LSTAPASTRDSICCPSSAPSGASASATRRFFSVDVDDEHVDLGGGGRGFAQRALTAPRYLGDVQQAVHAGHELDEHPELGRANGAPAHDLSLAQPAGHPRPTDHPRGPSG